MAKRKPRRGARGAAPQGPRPEATSRLTGAIDLFGLGLVFTLVFDLFFHQYFPNDQGRLGHDYSYFLPHLLAGDYWIHRNGPFAVPWFTPAFCGGVPMFANPQSPFYTVPQLLSALVFDPLTSVYVTVLLFAWLGYAGFYLLARRCFGASRPAAILGALLFMFNGLYTHRMMIGHLTFHAFMLIPLLAFLLLHVPGSEREDGGGGAWLPDVALAALPIAYMVMSGMIQMMLPALLAVGVVGIAHGMSRGGRVRFWVRFTAAGGIAGALCLARLDASGAFLAPFPRDDYKLPGAVSVLGVGELLLESLFVRPAHKTAADGVVVNQQWSLEQHEFEFGVTFVPLLAIAIGAAVALVRWKRTGPPRPSVRAGAEALVVVAVLIVPIALNYYTPSWNQTLKGLPLLRSSSSLFRWFSLYIPVVILAGTRAFDAASPAVLKWLAAGGGIAACLVVNLLADESFYQQQPYDPGAIQAAYGRISAGVPEIQTIGDPESGGDDSLARGVSPAMCYEPIFGYRLEHLPLKSLQPGPALAERNGVLNIKNPACYLFPAENHCAPGDHFPAGRKDAAAAFARYQPFPFEMPARQRLCNLVSLLALLGVLALLLVGPVRGLTGRGSVKVAAGRK